MVKLKECRLKPCPTEAFSRDPATSGKGNSACACVCQRAATGRPSGGSGRSLSRALSTASLRSLPSAPTGKRRGRDRLMEPRWPTLPVSHVREADAMPLGCDAPWVAEGYCGPKRRRDVSEHRGQRAMLLRRTSSFAERGVPIGRPMKILYNSRHPGANSHKGFPFMPRPPHRNRQTLSWLPRKVLV